jgi:hypothetical protein
MRALAQMLRAAASEFGAIAEAAGGFVHALAFEGPAATRIRGRVQDRTSAIRSAASALNDVADLLMRSAAQVEAAQAARQRAIEARARELANEAKLRQMKP